MQNRIACMLVSKRRKVLKLALYNLILLMIWLRGQDLNLGPSGYEPDELPGCSTPRQRRVRFGRSAGSQKFRNDNGGLPQRKAAVVQKT